MVKKVVLVLFVILTGFSLFGEENNAMKEYQLFSQALELLLDDKNDEALQLFHQLIAEYPESELREKAEKYISLYEGKLNHSGIVSFYLGWLGTAEWTSLSIPSILGIGEGDGVVMGISGILGIGAGLGAAWLQSRDNDMTLGQDLWIEGMEISSVVNSLLIFNLVDELIGVDRSWGDPSYNAKERIMSGFMITAGLTSRLLTYYSFKDKDPDSGHAAFTLASYAWAHFYTWCTMWGLLESKSGAIADYIVGLITTNTLAYVGNITWEEVGNWSAARTGIVSIGGIGGALLGASVDMILTTFLPDLSTPVIVGNIMIGAVGGKLLTAYWTRNMDRNELQAADEKGALALYPIFSPGAIGVGGHISF